MYNKFKNVSYKVASLLVIIQFLLNIPCSLFAGDQLNGELRLHTPESNLLLTNLPDITVQIPIGPLHHYVLQTPTNTDMLNTEANQVETYPIANETEVTEVSYDFPIVQNHSVDRQIVLFQTRLKEQITKGLSRVGRYIDMIHAILEESNLPKDLVFLPLIESNFSVHAASRAKAVGPWQFIKGTAKQYGLRVDPWIDERRDPVKSTRAAVAYLKDLYAMFNSWLFSLASYNAGESRIAKAIIKTKATDFWELRASGQIPLETQNYVPKFMAATIIAKNPELYGFSAIEYEAPLFYDEVKIDRPTSLYLIAHAMGITLEEIKAYNPELRKDTTPPNYPNYLLKLPSGMKELFRTNRSQINSPYKHKIKWGETIGSISKKYNVPTKKLLEINQLQKNSKIQAGRSLIIPFM